MLRILPVLLIIQWTKGYHEYEFGFPPDPENQREFVEKLRKEGLVESDRVVEVMCQVDRKSYIPFYPYEDWTTLTDTGVVDLAPYMHAFALETLNDHLKEGSRALEIGYGSGYLSVCMSLMVGNTGRVYGIEDTEKEVNYAINCTSRDHNLKSKYLPVVFLAGNASEIAPKYAPYDAIYCATTPEKPPKDILRLLKKGGRLLSSIGILGLMENMYIFDKLHNGTIVSHSKPIKFFANRVL